jgi:endonuclease-3
VTGTPAHSAVLRVLEATHGKSSKPRRDPVDELVLTILSQNTTDENRDRAWEALLASFPDWEAVRSAAPEDLEDAIRPAGLGRQKAAAIRGALDRIARERGRIALDHLESMSDSEALAYLTAMHGVGTKTAACVLCFSLRRSVIPVDTHVRRVAERLAWVPRGTDAQRAHAILNESVPAKLRLRLHLALIAHGRSTCTARRPACGRCSLEKVCPRAGVETR